MEGVGFVVVAAVAVVAALAAVVVVVVAAAVVVAVELSAKRAKMTFCSLVSHHRQRK